MNFYFLIFLATSFFYPAVVASRCGNKVLELPDEQCDDGNLRSGDGCDASCKIERGFSCRLQPIRDSATTRAALTSGSVASISTLTRSVPGTSVPADSKSAPLPPSPPQATADALKAAGQDATPPTPVSGRDAGPARWLARRLLSVTTAVERRLQPTTVTDASATTGGVHYFSVCKPIGGTQNTAQAGIDGDETLSQPMLYVVVGASVGFALILAVIGVVIGIVVRRRRRNPPSTTNDPEVGDLGMPGGLGMSPWPAVVELGTVSSRMGTLKMPVRKPLPAVASFQGRSRGQQPHAANQRPAPEGARPDDPPTETGDGVSSAWEDDVFLRGRKPEPNGEEDSSETGAADFSSDSDCAASDSDASDHNGDQNAFPNFLILDPPTFVPPSTFVVPPSSPFLLPPSTPFDLSPPSSFILPPPGSPVAPGAVLPAVVVNRRR
eukprot:TRINITY_DN2001_c0_g1_i1.p1 TRINITY_DN2001_c0_g1~~TRINITY_DN2001_c0_g1_i1.p1  ORF type:complete len:487 (-),score=80.00 TRINITY_DN2001_c0_g1_i1:906-2219(-)